MDKFPWSLQEAEARGFRVQQKDGLTLITATREKSKWAYDPACPLAHDSELVWRSTLLNEKLEVVSLGFPKFPNWGEFGWDTYNDYVTRSISDGTALLTAKEDGTLIIRSVYDGRVIWRTRNSFGLGPFEKPVMDLVVQNEWLSSPDFGDEGSMLFEYVAPTNKIVIQYDKPMLVLLATRDGHRIYEAHNAWKAFGINVVRTMKVSANNPIDLQKEISELERDGLWDCEGLVVRTPEGIMSKIKGSEYLNAFKMRYFFKYADFAALCMANEVQTLDAAKAVCVANGVDWEVLTCAENWWEVYWQRWNDYQQAVKWGLHAVLTWEGDARAEFAKWVSGNAPCTSAATVAFAALDRKEDKLHKVVQKVRDKAIFAPVSIENRNPWFSLQEEA